MGDQATWSRTRQVTGIVREVRARRHGLPSEVERSPAASTSGETPWKPPTRFLLATTLDTDPVAEQALADFYENVDRLVVSGRLPREAAAHLSATVASCGPLVPSVLLR